jgi:hypothetical protein
MSESENGNRPGATQTAGSRISRERWQQIKTAHASGFALREIARNMGVPEGTVLARAKREGWRQEIENAKALASRENEASTVTPVEAVAMSMQKRGERHLGRMANIVERPVPHVEAMEPGAILDLIDGVETLDKIGRRAFGISDVREDQSQIAVNIAILNA